MKRLLIPLALLFVISLSSAELQPIDCFDYYEMGSVDIALNLDKIKYLPSDMMLFEGIVKNSNLYPVTEGSIRVQILYQERLGVEYMLDEFFVGEDIYLEPGESKEFGGVWDVPGNAKAGRYLIEAYYIIDEFNLAGVSFLRGMAGEVTSFKVEGGTDLVYMDVERIRVNEEDVGLRETQPLQLPREPITVTVPLVNEGPAVTAKVTYRLYNWDDLTGTSLVAEKSEEIGIPQDSHTTLAYYKSELPTGSYLLKITVETDKNDNLLKLRIPLAGRRAKLNFLGLDTFPIRKGDEVKIFVCASNSADYDLPLFADIAVTLVDEEGNEIFADSIKNENVTPLLVGYVTSFKADKDYYMAKLTSDIIDEVGNAEFAELVYEREKPDEKPHTPIPPTFPPAKPPEQPADNTPLLLILLVLIILAALLYYKKTR